MWSEAEDCGSNNVVQDFSDKLNECQDDNSSETT